MSLFFSHIVIVITIGENYLQISQLNFAGVRLFSLTFLVILICLTFTVLLAFDSIENNKTAFFS